MNEKLFLCRCLIVRFSVWHVIETLDFHFLDFSHFELLYSLRYFCISIGGMNRNNDPTSLRAKTEWSFWNVSKIFCLLFILTSKRQSTCVNHVFNRGIKMHGIYHNYRKVENMRPYLVYSIYKEQYRLFVILQIYIFIPFLGEILQQFVQNWSLPKSGRGFVVQWGHQSIIFSQHRNMPTKTERFLF